jgi:hypothetical protein
LHSLARSLDLYSSKVGAQCLDLSLLQIAPLPGVVLVSLSVVQQVAHVVQLVSEVNMWGVDHRLSVVVTLSDVLETSAGDRLRVKKGKAGERLLEGSDHPVEPRTLHHVDGELLRNGGNLAPLTM